MKMRLQTIATMLMLVLGCAQAQSNLETPSMMGLTTEYSETPLGIDVKQPRFSWQMQTARPGARQTAYQIIVKDENWTEMWNSGRQESSTSLGIYYQRQTLKPSTRYDWQLTAVFSTSLPSQPTLLPPSNCLTGRRKNCCQDITKSRFAHEAFVTQMQGFRRICLVV